MTLFPRQGVSVKMEGQKKRTQRDYTLAFKLAVV
ncbi:putative transposase [Ralstonia pickettii]|nr:putative transposase [Ralstonia pickettii]